MAICNWCKRDMSDPAVVGCTANTEVEFPDGTLMAAILYNPDYGGEDHRCHDCNVKVGQHHHPGCDMERCPKCQGQLIGCGCLEDDESDDPDEDRIAELAAKVATLKADNAALNAALYRLRGEAAEWQKKWEDLESHRAACCDAMEDERDAALARLAKALEKIDLDLLSPEELDNLGAVAVGMLHKRKDG